MSGETRTEWLLEELIRTVREDAEQRDERIDTLTDEIRDLRKALIEEKRACASGDITPIRMVRDPTPLPPAPFNLVPTPPAMPAGGEEHANPLALTPAQRTAWHAVRAAAPVVLKWAVGLATGGIGWEALRHLIGLH